MRSLTLLLPLLALGCGSSPPPAPEISSSDSPTTTSASAKQTLTEARQGFQTNIVKPGDDFGPPDQPPADAPFELIKYTSPVGELAAYLTKDPQDGQKHPAIVWITGGDNNSIGDVWSPGSRDNDQTAAAFRKAGIVMMFPSQRGGNDNPGQREGFYGEADDILAATDHLATLPYVDPDQIYLGGHSTGGTMAMIVGECSDRYKAIFALGPVAAVQQYGGDYLYCDVNNDQEVRLRSPIYWLDGVKSPMFVIEGMNDGNWQGSIDIMAEDNKNPNIKFFPVPGHDHFSVIAPLAELLAQQILSGNVDVTESMLSNLR